MRWRHVTKKAAGFGRHAFRINEHGDKVFPCRASIQRGKWAALMVDGHCKTDFSCAELAKQYVENRRYKQASRGL